jgi:hypothetical protein
MISRSLRLLLLPCVLGATGPAPDSPFIGDWKLNPARSSMPDEMKVESAGGNKYTFDFGGGPETIVVDGTDQATPLNAKGTLSVAVEGAGWRVVRKANGRTILSAAWSLSKDDSTLTDRFTAFNADGSPYTLNYIYRRTAAGSGFAGTWVSSSMEAVNFVAVVKIRPLEKDGFSIVDPASQLTGNLDFAAPLVRRVDERTLEFMRKTSGGDEPQMLMRLTLSPDLKSLTITPRSIPHRRPTILVLDRQ